MRASEFNEGIHTMQARDFRGGKNSLELPRNFKNTATQLPGGSGFVYTVTSSGYSTAINIWDPKGPDYINAANRPVRKPRETSWAYYDRVENWNNSKIAPGQLIGTLEISPHEWFPIGGAVQVDTITVDEDYRGRGIAKALYGIVLTIMKRPLVAGELQTPGGRRNWVSLAGIPGVEMKGYVGFEKYELVPNRPSQNKQAERNIDTVMGQLGGDYIGQTPSGRHFFAFDVQPNTTGKELEAHVKTKMSKVYGDTYFYSGLYATWSGSKLEEEPLDEAETDTPNARKISNQLRAAGYSHVGAGADATVWAKDDSHVIKILMPEDAGSKAEQVFRKFYEFSMSRQDLACVPRFNEVNTIDINGKDYTQIEMEKLSSIPKGSFVEGLIWFLSHFTSSPEPWETMERELADPNTWKNYSPQYANAFAKVWQSLLENPASKKTYAMYKQLYTVMQILYNTGRINKFGWDLHTANVMLRQNGQPVIIDPWFSEGTS